MKKWLCRLMIHDWVEPVPRTMFDLNDYYCSRCGAHKRQGLYS